MPDLIYPRDVCAAVFFVDELRTGLIRLHPCVQHRLPTTVAPSSFAMEQKYVTKLKLVIRLSLCVISIIANAAAIGSVVGGFLSGLNLSEHEELLGVMRAHLEDLDQNTE